MLIHAYNNLLAKALNEICVQIALSCSNLEPNFLNVLSRPIVNSSRKSYSVKSFDFLAERRYETKHTYFIQPIDYVERTNKLTFV